jgi:hypothetical protein
VEGGAWGGDDLAVHEDPPAVGQGDGTVHLDVQLAQLLNVGRRFVGIVEAIVQVCQTGIRSFAGSIAKKIVLRASLRNRNGQTRWLRERLKARCIGVSESSTKRRAVFGCPDRVDARLKHSEGGVRICRYQIQSIKVNAMSLQECESDMLCHL